jgi:hypothetical protein
MYVIVYVYDMFKTGGFSTMYLCYLYGGSVLLRVHSIHTFAQVEAQFYIKF